MIQCGLHVTRYNCGYNVPPRHAISTSSCAHTRVRGVVHSLEQGVGFGSYLILLFCAPWRDAVFGARNKDDASPVWKSEWCRGKGGLRSGRENGAGVKGVSGLGERMAPGQKGSPVWKREQCRGKRGLRSGRENGAGAKGVSGLEERTAPGQKGSPVWKRGRCRDGARGVSGLAFFIHLG